MKTRTASFHIESDLLKELGERLVSEPEVALTELIKNSYDADSTECRVSFRKGEIGIIDDGSGMTESDFLNKWMTIATSNKLKEKKSPRFSRPMTGSKGIGRFAARFLGNELSLLSVTLDQKTKQRSRLEADFNWDQLDETQNIKDIKIEYRVHENVQDDLGTTLIITDLKRDLDRNIIKSVKSGSLDIESPLYNLIKNAPPSYKDLCGSPKGEDPGFSLKVQEDENNFESSLSEQVLKNYVFRAEVLIENKKFTTKIYHETKGLIYHQTFPSINPLNTKCYADLYWFPRRAGIFTQKGFDGKRAWSWVRENSGVAIYDHGFRVRPYGLQDNDWLSLDRDAARNLRHWRTRWAEEEFPITNEAQESPKLNPVLKLSTSFQMVGSVFVASNPGNSSEALSPSMDRQGFVDNESFKFLKETVRFAIEAIAHFDKKFQLEQEEEKRKQYHKGVRSDLETVIKDIKSSRTLENEDKDRLIAHYTKIINDVENLEEYDRQSRENLEAMSLLGVVAGFMTHEFQAALMQLERAQKVLKLLSKKDSSFEEPYTSLQKVVDYFVGYIDYTKLFINNLQTPANEKRVNPLSAIEYVIDIFERFQKDRSISIDINTIDPELPGPKIQLAIYHGIFHNLYTNALKALLGSKQKKPTIKVLAWNEKEKHILQVMDNGPGIPEHSRSRIWDPMFTTTSSQTNPLGSGMGLGLPLVKKVVNAQKGSISVIEAPTGFSTCIKVELPLN